VVGFRFVLLFLLIVLLMIARQAVGAAVAAIADLPGRGVMEAKPWEEATDDANAFLHIEARGHGHTDVDLTKRFHHDLLRALTGAPFRLRRIVREEHLFVLPGLRHEVAKVVEEVLAGGFVVVDQADLVAN
jgi:hypothetical protein